MKPASIELHIEELVLDGFDAGDPHRVAETVEAELGRLFDEGGVPPALSRGGDLAQLDGGPFVAVPGMGSEEVGVAVARAVYGGLT